jgi:AraC family transcriptional regulator, exoenzyme S synthesis regulatory protein ExsA
MLLSHQKIDFGDTCLIEKLIIQAPFRFSVHFHDEAYFVYFLEGETMINSPYERTGIGPGESILFKRDTSISGALNFHWTKSWVCFRVVSKRFQVARAYCFPRSFQRPL